MDRKTILLFTFDGFSDWEPSYATVGISISDTYLLQTVGITKEPVTSMGGLTVVPDLEIKEADLSNTAMLILPGGTYWEKELALSNPDNGEETEDLVRALVGHCLANDIPVAAICAATEFLARAGWLDDIDHTSNHPDFLKAAAPDYKGASKYQMEPVVSDHGIITASGTSPIAFAKEIFVMLNIDKNEELRDWFQWFEKFNSEVTGIV